MTVDEKITAPISKTLDRRRMSAARKSGSGDDCSGDKKLPSSLRFHSEKTGAGDCPDTRHNRGWWRSIADIQFPGNTTVGHEQTPFCTLPHHSYADELVSRELAPLVICPKIFQQHITAMSPTPAIHKPEPLT